MVSDWTQTGIQPFTSSNLCLSIQKMWLKNTLSKDELHQVSIASGLMSDSNFHKVAQRLGQKENFEKFMATCPELGYNKVRVTLIKYGKPF